MSLDVSAVNILPNPVAAQAAVRDEAVARSKAAAAAENAQAVSMSAILGDLADISASFNKRLSFQLNEKLGQVVVKVIDTDTDKVIREIPPAEIQHVHERIREVIGILFDERA